MVVSPPSQLLCGALIPTRMVVGGGSLSKQVMTMEPSLRDCRRRKRPELPVHPSCEGTGRKWPLQARKRVLTRRWLCSTSILDFWASTIVRNNCLLVKSRHVWYFGRADEHTNTVPLRHSGTAKMEGKQSNECGIRRGLWDRGKNLDT